MGFDLLASVCETEQLLAGSGAVSCGVNGHVNKRDNSLASCRTTTPNPPTTHPFLSSQPHHSVVATGEKGRR